MNVPPSTASPAFDPLALIDQFAASPDARLRANAAHALAAVVHSSEKPAADRAQAALIDLLCSEPGNAHDPEWSLRFARRAVSSLERLPPEAGRAVRTALTERLEARRTSPSQREAIGHLLAADWQRFPPQWGVGALRFGRVLRSLGRPSFLPSAWAATWRLALAWALLWLVPLYYSPAQEPLFRSAVDPFLAGVVALAILARSSPAGRLPAPVPFVWRDCLVAALIYAILALAAIWLALAPGASLLRFGAPDAESTTAGITVGQWAIAGAIGGLIGGVLRSVRWLALRNVLEPAGMAAWGQIAFAFVLVTAVCTVAVKLGGDSQVAAAVWVTVAPVALAGAFLDRWLAASGFQFEVDVRTAQAHATWVLPALVSGLGLAAAALIAWNVHALRGQLESERTIQLPRDVSEKGFARHSVRFGQRVPIQVEQTGWYRIVGDLDPNAARDTRDMLLVLTKSDGRVLKEKDDPDPPTVLVELPGGKDGRYFACVATFGAEGCSDRGGLIAVKSVLELGSRLIAGKFFTQDAEPTDAPTDRADAADRRSARLSVFPALGACDGGEDPRPEDLREHRIPIGTIEPCATVVVKRPAEPSGGIAWSREMDRWDGETVTVKRIFSARSGVAFQVTEARFSFSVDWISEIKAPRPGPDRQPAPTPVK